MIYKKPFHLLLVVSMLLACQRQPAPITAAAPQLKQVKPDNTKAAKFHRLDSLLQQSIKDQKLAGAVAMIAQGDKIIHYQSYGWQDKEQQKPMQKDHIFRIASMTKSVTSVAVMMLYEEGKLQLDDPVSKYIPEFADAQVLAQFNKADSSHTTVPARTAVTIKHLLTHTSGLGYGFVHPSMGAIYAKAGVPDAYTLENVSLAEKMKILAGLPLMHHPGEKWTYGLSTDMLGYLVEKVSGMPLDRFFQERIFKPLGMEDTYFYLPENKAKRLVTLYSETKEGLQRADQLKGVGYLANFPISGAKTYFSGGGGLSSTARDYMVFAQMLLNGGHYKEVKLLSPSTVQLMTSNQIGELSLDKNKFGLGFYVMTEKGQTAYNGQVGKYGWSGLFNTFYWIDPAEGVIGILMTQVFPTTHKELYPHFERLTYEALWGEKQ